ncbi:DUF2254 domain-containing protein [Novosphingobium sp. M1R2S20]|uniref:DUF2254 domain-containing protein n=1 Tax=Novosphingobium rhizovicinum TaxID=3228928 RepID=A0ABV3R948_9SPHN
MRSRLFAFVEVVRASYWFIPSIMASLAILLGALTVWLDSGPASDLLNGISWYQSAKPDGAHEVLSTIAGSMITVAGVVFSITIVALSYASSQYGPRLLTNFMTDRGNQVTLGTFIATFLYCLVVLRTIRGGDEEFVPQLAVMIGMLLGLASIGVLIYFIHHVPQSIHINNVAARIGRQLIDSVDKRFPQFIGQSAEFEEHVEHRVAQAAEALSGRGEDQRVASIAGSATGYIEAVDDNKLMEEARRYDLVVRLRYRPGDYLHAGRTLLQAWPAERVTRQAADGLRASYAVGDKRTPFGDLDFLIEELVEIAARALSPGVNDPATARTCFDWLGAGASEIARRHLPQPERADKDGTIRVIAQPEGFDDYMARAFGALRQYAATDMTAALHMLRTLGGVAVACSNRMQLAAVRAEAQWLLDMADCALTGQAIEEVRRRGAALKDLIDRGLADGSPAMDAMQANWLSGTA